VLAPEAQRSRPALHVEFFRILTLMGHGQLVRADKLSPLRVGIVARHGSFRSILPFLGVRIVLKRFVRADKLSPLRVGIVARHGSLRSILPFLGVRIVLKRFASFRSVLVSIGVRIILRLLRRR